MSVACFAQHGISYTGIYPSVGKCHSKMPRIYQNWTGFLWRLAICCKIQKWGFFHPHFPPCFLHIHTIALGTWGQVWWLWLGQVWFVPRCNGWLPPIHQVQRIEVNHIPAWSNEACFPHLWISKAPWTDVTLSKMVTHASMPLVSPVPITGLPWGESCKVLCGPQNPYLPVKTAMCGS